MSKYTAVAALLLTQIGSRTHAFQTIPGTAITSGLATRSLGASSSLPCSPFVSRTQSRPCSTSSTSLNVFGGVEAFMQAAPYATAFITGGLKSSAADLITQAQERRHSARSALSTDLAATAGLVAAQPQGPSNTKIRNFDLKRNFSFMLYGGFCLGVAYEWIYNVLFPRMFGTGTHLSAAIAKTGAEIFVIAPLLSIPISYVINAAINRTSFRKALGKYWQDVTKKRLLTTYCAVFGPVQVALFTLVPAHLRMTVASAVSFLWLMAFSKISATKGDAMGEVTTVASA